MSETTIASPTTPTSEQALFNIEKLYVKDLSLEIPHAPAIFLERENPTIDLVMNTTATPLEEGVYEVTITVTVTAKIPEKDKVMFLIEAKQAGIFQVRNIPVAEAEPILVVVCPNILYPYLREVVSDVAVRAGFAAVILNPMNFEGLYHQQKQKQNAPAVTH